MMLSLIAVIGKNRELGKNNGLLWHVPGDLPRFKKLTMGHPVIMGKRTYESLPKKFRPLVGRTNIVLCGEGRWMAPGAKVVGSWEEAKQTAEKSPGSEEVFVGGGGMTYKTAIGEADRLYLTVVEATDDEADTFFPEYEEFDKVVSVEEHESRGLKYRYEVRER